MIQFRDIFRVPMSAVGVTAAQDLFEVAGPSNGICAVLGLRLYQTTDLGDAQEEILRVTLLRAATSGSGGTSGSAKNANPNGAAFGGTVELNNTARAGTPVIEEEIGWNIRIPEPLIWTPETLTLIAPSGIVAIGLEAAPLDSITISGTLTFGVI